MQKNIIFALVDIIVRDLLNYVRKALLLITLFLSALVASAKENLTHYVNTFIGTANYGTTNPGAVCPNGMMSVTPFNVMRSELNRYDKDKRWNENFLNYSDLLDGARIEFMMHTKPN